MRVSPVLGLWAVLLLFCFPAFSQNNDHPTGRFVLRVSPQHLVLNGYHLDIEKQLKQAGNQSIIFSPRFYKGSTGFADAFSRRKEEEEDNSRVLGFGAELVHRIYLHDLTELYDKNFYFGYGVNFHRFSIDFQKDGWIETMAEDGLAYYRFRNLPFKEKINRWGAILYLGLQESLIPDRVMLDLYLGMGYNHSSNESTYPVIRFNRNMVDYGFSGIYYYPGVKIGIIL